MIKRLLIVSLLLHYLEAEVILNEGLGSSLVYIFESRKIVSTLRRHSVPTFA